MTTYTSMLNTGNSAEVKKKKLLLSITFGTLQDFAKKE